MAESDASIKVYVYDGQTYMGKFVADNKVSNPVKITFTYENTTSTSAKLTWLLSPVLPIVLAVGDNVPVIQYAAGSIIVLKNAAGNDFDGTMIDANVLTAYKSVTREA